MRDTAIRFTIIYEGFYQTASERKSQPCSLQSLKVQVTDAHLLDSVNVKAIQTRGLVTARVRN